MILLYSIIIIFLVAGVVSVVLKSTGESRATCPDFLAGRWRVADSDREIEFGRGSAGYCESGGRIDTFAFVVKGDRLTVSQDCVVKRYRIVRSADGLRLESKNDTLVLKRQPQNDLKVFKDLN